jgi:transposase-like protein
MGELRLSGLGVEDFAVRHGIGAHRIYYWRKRLEAEEGSTPRLIEMRLSDTSPRPTMPEPRVEVELSSGRRLSVSETIDPRRLEALVMALEGR